LVSAIGFLLIGVRGLGDSPNADQQAIGPDTAPTVLILKTVDISPRPSRFPSHRARKHLICPATLTRPSSCLDC
jgi:hypothetical protein